MNKKSVLQLQVRFNDIDVAGHVHNAIYFNYFEIGRIDFFGQFISPKTWNWKKKGLVVARNEADHLLPIVFEDEIFIETTLDNVGTKSISLQYKIFKNCKDEGVKKLCAQGRSILVCMDYELNKSVEVFSEWKQKIYS